MYGGLNWSPLGGEATRLGQRVIVCVELKLKTSFILSGGQSMVIIKDKGSRVTFFTEAKEGMHFQIIGKFQTYVYLCQNIKKTKLTL